MSLFERIQKRILNEEDKRQSNRDRYNQVEKDRREARREERREKKFSKNISNKVNTNKDRNTQNPSSRTNKPKRGSTTFVPGGQRTLPDFDPDSGKIVTDTKGKPLFGTEPPKEKKVKTTYTKKPPVQTPPELSGPLFDQQPRKKGFRSFVKSPAYYARQREKTDAGRKRYDFVPDKDGKFDFNPETKKGNIEKYARRMLSRKQIDSKSNVPIDLTPDDLAKAEGDARSKYGGRDMKKARKTYTRNTFRQGQKEFDKMFKTIRTGEGGTGESDPFADKKNNRRRTNTPPKVEKPVKQFGGKSFDDFLRDSERKRKKTMSDVKNIGKTKVGKIGSKITVGNQIPYNPPPLKDPTKGLKFKKLRTKIPKNKVLKSVMKAARKNPRTAAAALALGTVGSLYTATKLLGPKSSVPPVGGGDNKIVAPIATKLNIDPSKVEYYKEKQLGSGNFNKKFTPKNRT